MFPSLDHILSLKITLRESLPVWFHPNVSFHMIHVLIVQGFRAYVQKARSIESLESGPVIFLHFLPKFNLWTRKLSKMHCINASLSLSSLLPDCRTQAFTEPLVKPLNGFLSRFTHFCHKFVAAIYAFFQLFFFGQTAVFVMNGSGLKSYFEFEVQWLCSKTDLNSI